MREQETDYLIRDMKLFERSRSVPAPCRCFVDDKPILALLFNNAALLVSSFSS